MHQTFYIDIDEEITSIVEKLRKTEAPEVIMAVPKRAMLIQSIVNLKLLRKVADDLGVKLSIVTQDKLGKLLIGKAGISLQQKLEDEDDADDDEESVSLNYDNNKKEKVNEMNVPDVQEVTRSKRRLDRIGSSEYFSHNNGMIVDVEAKEFAELKKPTVKSSPNHHDRHRYVDKKPFSEISVEEDAYSSKGVFPSMDVATSRHAKTSKMTTHQDFMSTRKTNSSVVDFSEREREKSRDRQVEQFFYANNFSENKRNDSIDKIVNKKNNGTGLRFMVIILAVGLVGGLLYGAYLFVPKATITLFAQKEIKSADMNIIADIARDSIDYEKLVIPAKIMDFEEIVSKTFDTTGSSNVSDQKAKGKIVIYNEFSSSPQPLIATTRFISEDQKVFRLVQGVTIPGTMKIGSEAKPGVVEAEIVADESGEAYNIGSTNFSIPGFKDSGSEKYAKIYAKSTTAMTGGGKGTSSVKAITDKDILSAKDKVSLEITSLIKKKIKESSQGDVVVLDDSIFIEEPLYSVSGTVGEITDNFEIKVQAKAKAIIFQESDLKLMATSVIAKSASGKTNMDNGAMIIDYGKVNADLKLGTLDISANASNVMQPNFDLEILKKGFLGRNIDEITEYLKDYPSIEKAEVEYWPPMLVSKIPAYAKRVEVILNYTIPQ